MNWFDCLLAFANVVKQESFIGAARELSITNSAITKRIQWLEKKLACTLLLRTTRKVLPTDAGEYLLARINPLLEEWQNIHAQLLDYKSQPRGEISVALAPNLSGLPILMTAFEKFLQEQPNLRLQFSTIHKPVNLLNEKIDVLIATEKYLLDPFSTVGIKLLEFSYQCCATPAYIKKHGIPQTLADLKKHNCLIYRDNNQWEFAGNAHTVTGNLQADTADSLLLACTLGMGIIYMPDFMIQKELEQKIFKRVFTKLPTKKDTLMLFYTQHNYKPRKIELLINFLKKLKHSHKDTK